MVLKVLKYVLQKENQKKVRSYLRAYHSGNYVFIEIEDDGAGINREKVLEKAISKGIVTKESAVLLTDNQINELILASGFSTAEVISDFLDEE